MTSSALRKSVGQHAVHPKTRPPHLNVFCPVLKRIADNTKEHLLRVDGRNRESDRLGVT